MPEKRDVDAEQLNSRDFCFTCDCVVGVYSTNGGIRWACRNCGQTTGWFHDGEHHYGAQDANPNP